MIKPRFLIPKVLTSLAKIYFRLIFIRAGTFCSGNQKAKEAYGDAA